MANNIVESFNRHFSHLSGESVVIYGTGKIAKQLAEGRGELVFSIAGIMDRYKTEGEFIGIPIVNMQNVHHIANIIIIAAFGRNCHIVYRRISKLEVKGIDIYYPDGEKRSVRDQKGTAEFFTQMRNKLSALIDESDVISFDVFDTLVFRKCLYPEEIFSLLEDEGNPEFAVKRIEAAKTAQSELQRNPTIYDIYEHIDCVSADEEIALEKQLLTARGDMMFFYNYAKQQGKKIVLTSDMHLTGHIIRELMDSCGIVGYEKLYVSCDLNKTKYDGDIWNCLLSDYPEKRILHIGDNQLSDSINKGNLSSYVIKGTVEIADLLGFGEIIETVSDHREYCVIGTVLERLLKLDLTQTDDTGAVIIENTEDLAYCFIAPLTVGFVTWLAKKAAENGEEYLYFCARDGYMPMKLYEKLRDKYNAPPGRYLYTSKSLVGSVLCDSMEVIRDIIQVYIYLPSVNATVSQAIYRRFGIKLPKDDVLDKHINDTSIDEIMSRIEKAYFGLFKERAIEAKKNLDAYNTKNGFDAETASLVDLVCGHSIKFTHMLYKGSYYACLAQDKSSTGVDLSGIDVYSWYENTGGYYLNSKFNVVRYAKLAEAVHAKPEGTCLAIDEFGNPVLHDEECEPEANNRIYSGVEAFYDDSIYCAGYETADRIFGLIGSGIYNIDKAIEGIKWSSYGAFRDSEQV